VIGREGGTHRWPCWGVRLQANLLHDGSAKNIPQAILAHRGQGQAASNAFASLDFHGGGFAF